MPAPPPNAYSPGTKLTVGSHDISIIKYISEGGFAHVYTCNISPPFRGSEIACLKRVAVPNKWLLNLLRQEVDAMKRLKGNDHIVSYIDSHASRLTHLPANSSGEQQYEVFVLMEYCSKNGLIDFMNTRLTHKLTEPEILTIMHDITIGVAMCHHLKPPLIHRDIKIENVLIDSEGVYKLCDFGSAVEYHPVPKTSKEFKQLHDDLMQHTTPQYRAPEMIDLSRGFPIDDKLDIWALGCFLYKLCYYTTPFELPNHTSLEDMEKQILNSSHILTIPHNRPGQMFSSRLKNVIKCCLREDPRRRPNAVQLLEEICLMKGISKVPDVIPYTLKGHHNHNHNVKNAPSKDVHKPLPKAPVRDISAPNLPIKAKNDLKPADPFASIDRSKILKTSSSIGNKPSNKMANHRNSTYVSTYISSKSKPSPRPMSAYIEDEKSLNYRSASPKLSSSASSAANLKDFIKKQIDESTDDLASINRYDGQESGTLNFLKSKEEENYKTLSNLRQNTGGSFKNSIKNGLRRINTGGSSSSIASNYQDDLNVSNKRSSILSLKQMFSGNSKRSSSPEDYNQDQKKSPELTHIQSPQDDKPAKKLSIQRRMQMLMKSSDEPTVKTAEGYGKFTENNIIDQDDISAINENTLSSSSSDEVISPQRRIQAHGLAGKTRPIPPKIPQALSSSKNAVSRTEHLTRTSNKTSTPGQHSKKPPPKPIKPTYLKSTDNHTNHERNLSTSSAISLPDLDDLEKDFSKRFPSFV